MKNKIILIKKSNSGVTLISLVVTIIILIILAVVGTDVGISTLNSAKLTQFTTQMKLMQIEVNDLYDKYTNNGVVRLNNGAVFTGEEIIKGNKEGLTIGKSIDDADAAQVSKTFETVENKGSGITDTTGYYFFDKETISNLGIEGVDQEFFINVAKRSVISYKGLNYYDDMYYTLEQLPEGLYNVEYLYPNMGKPTFDLGYEKITDGRYRVTVSNIQYDIGISGYISNWNVKYQRVDEEEETRWYETEELSFIVSDVGVYNVMIYQDNIESEIKQVNLVAFRNLDVDNTDPGAAMPIDAEVIEEDADKGIVIRDANKNEWVWVEVPKSIYTDSAYNGGVDVIDTSDLNAIYSVLNNYAGVYREGAKGQGLYWKDEWYALDGETVVSESAEGLTDEQKALNNGCGLTYDEYNENYEKMLKSVYDNGGFWIARYEAGIEGTTGAIVEGDTSISSLGRTESNKGRITSTSPKAISQKNAIPYNYVYCSEAQMLASAMTPDSTKTSSLMFGIQWDLVCKYLEGKDGLVTANINEDSTDWGNYSNKALTIDSTNSKKYNSTTWIAKTDDKTANSLLISTGASTIAKKMNIYDFAGNEWEWTLEQTGSAVYLCAYRGGSCGDIGNDYPVSFRNGGTTIYNDSSRSFRATLY